MVSDAGVFTGTVKVSSDQKGYVIVVKFRKQGQGQELLLEDKHPLSEDGRY